jgi:hypothetical protein
MKLYQGVVEAWGGVVSSPWLLSVEAVMEWGKRCGFDHGLILESEGTE